MRPQPTLPSYLHRSTGTGQGPAQDHQLTLGAGGSPCLLPAPQLQASSSGLGGRGRSIHTLWGAERSPAK